MSRLLAVLAAALTVLCLAVAPGALGSTARAAASAQLPEDAPASPEDSRDGGDDDDGDEDTFVRAIAPLAWAVPASSARRGEHDAARARPGHRAALERPPRA